MAEERFQAGMREYLREFSYGNATWPDLISILDRLSDEDLETWSEVWVNTPGRPTFFVVGDEQASGAGSVAIVQTDLGGQGRIWPQDFTVMPMENSPPAQTTLRFVEEHTDISGLVSSPHSPLLMNVDGMGYGLFLTDLVNLDHWAAVDDVARASLLIEVYENLLVGNGIAIDEYFAQLTEIAATETNQLVLGLATGSTQPCVLELPAIRRSATRCVRS